MKVYANILIIFCLSFNLMASDLSSRVSKAKEILVNTEVVSTSLVSDTGIPTESAWALSVIKTESKDPVLDLSNLAENGSVECAVMCLIAIKEIDHRKYSEILKEQEQDILESKEIISVQNACSIFNMSLKEVIKTTETWPKEWIFLDPIPSLYKTTRVIKKKPR